MSYRHVKTAQSNDAVRRRPLAAFAVQNTVLHFSANPRNHIPIHRKASCSCGGECPACQTKSNHLRVSQANDRAEVEADQIADNVMRMPRSVAVNAKGGGEPFGIQPNTHSPIVHAKHSSDAGSAAIDSDLGCRIHSSRGNGHALDSTSRGFFEPRFGASLERVRIHTGSEAATLSRELSAKAFTVGDDIFFGAGQYQPDTENGKSLLAHELTHVEQQSGSGAAPIRRSNKRGLHSGSPANSLIQRKVVDDDAHLPCRAVPGRSAADVTARENAAATLAENAAVAVRANPLAESTRELIWRRFRLDYNDPLTRCRFLPEIGDRFARIAREIRSTEMTYQCTATGEPSSYCNGNYAVYTYSGTRIDLCSMFWTNPQEQAPTLLHEWAHYLYGRRGVHDEPRRGFDTAECYNAFASEMAGLSPPVGVACAANTNPLPALNRHQIQQPCSSNLFVNLSAVGGYAYGLPGSRHYGTVGGGLDLLFPLTRMHDWELGVGARFLNFAPTDSNDRAAYLLGVRTALSFRYRPWRFGWQFGGYLEGGGIRVPEGPTGNQLHPYGAAGLSGGLNFHLSRQTVLQILGEVGGGVGFDIRRDDHFRWFQSGLSVVLQFQ